MSKIFGIGLQRSGTTSLARALLQLEIKTCHYVRHPEEWKLADAFLDAPVFSEYQRLDREFPGSKFICTCRNLRKWASSYIEKVVDLHFKNYTQPTTMNLRANLAVFGTLENQYLRDSSFLIDKHQQHVLKANEYFRNRPGDFLLLKIDEDPRAVQQSLQDFLGVTASRAEFPFDPNPTSHSWESLVHPLKVRVLPALP